MGKAKKESIKKLQEREYYVIELIFQCYGKVITKQRKDINEFEQEHDSLENPVLLHVRVSATSQRRLFSAADQGTYGTLFDVEENRGRMCNVQRPLT